MPTGGNRNIVGPDETPANVTQGGHIANAPTFDKIIPCVRRPIHDGSGGQQLDNVPTGGVQLRNASGNHLMFIGGVGNSAPFSGRGMSLYGNEPIWLPVTNMNAISVMATVSGEFIECMGFLDGHETQISVSGMYIRPDPNAPNILSVTPVSGISGVQRNAQISVLFDKCIDASTVTASSFVVRVSGSSTNISGIVSADLMNCAQYYMTPYSGTISGGTMYRATLGTSILAVNGVALGTSGVWHWITVSGAPPADTAGPTISGSVPASGTLDVGINTSPQLLFSEQLQSGTVNSNNIKVLLYSANGNPRDITVTLDPDLRTVTIDPVDPLSNNKRYFITVYSGGIKDRAGNAFSGTTQIPIFMEDGNWNQVYNVAIGDDTANLDDFRFRAGMKFLPGSFSENYIGQTIVKVRFYMNKNHSPLSGNNANDGLSVILHSEINNTDIQFERPFSVYMNPAELTNDLVAYDFYQPDNDYATQANDRFYAQWISGNAGDRVQLSIVNNNVSNPVVHTDYIGHPYSGAHYRDYSGVDIAGMFWTR